MDLVQKKAQLRKMEKQFNIMKLETRLLELDEEKEKIVESIAKQKEELNKEDT